MALAVADAPQTSSAPRKTEPASLSYQGLVGTIYVILAYLAVAHLVPWAYSQLVTKTGLLAGFGLFVAIGAAAAFAIYLWNKLFPPLYGLRAAVAVGVGNIILGFIVVFLAGYFLDWLFGRFLGDARLYVGLGIMAALAGWWINKFILQAFHAASFPKRMQKFEDGGWFTAEPYKKLQALRIRRITMVTIIGAVGAGVYYYIWRTSSISTGSAPYVWDIPFVSSHSLILFRSPSITIPLLLLGVAIWFAYRLVNHPPMAEFLINTEAEMAKVTWTSRKRLIRDTGVVLLCVLFFAVFLYLLDIIWVLVLGAIGVLQN
ncbi:MAG: preprotein translocase subunit SecE [Gemmatales bacterium]